MVNDQDNADEMKLITIARWIHILAAAAWLGEVVTVVFVLAPAAVRLQGERRADYIARVFPRVFRVASVLALVTLAAGAWLNYLMTGWRQLDLYLRSARGQAILAGGLLGLLLAVFHFVVEGKLEPKVRALIGESEGELAGVSRFLKWVPRAGLAVLLAVFILMMIGAKGA